MHDNTDKDALNNLEVKLFLYVQNDANMKFVPQNV